MSPQMFDFLLGWAMTRPMFDLLIKGMWETVVMTGVSGALSFVIGLPLALILVTLYRPNGMFGGKPQ